MTRVVVQRGSAGSNPSRSAASSLVSCAPAPPPLPPPYVCPSPTSVTDSNLQKSAPSSKDCKDERPRDSFGELARDDSEACFCFLARHFSNDKQQINLDNEGYEHGQAARELEGKTAQLSSEVSISHAKLGLNEKEYGKFCLAGNEELVDNGNEASECQTIKNERECLRMQQEDRGLQTLFVDDLEKLERENPASDFGKNRILSAQFESSSSVEHPRSLLISSPSYISTPFFGLEAEPQRHHKEMTEQVRVVPEHMSENMRSHLPASCVQSLPPVVRRTNFAASQLPSGSKLGSFSRRVPRNIRTSKSSPHSSHSTSPRSYGEGDGYNSSDEQSQWGSGSFTFSDDDERTHQFEIEIRRAKGLEIRRMLEDGNCLFRAVADQVYGDAEMHGETRLLCIDYMEKERDHFSQFVTESFTAYCKRKRRDKVYGNNLEIQAMAEMYNRPIHIYACSIEPINIFQGSYETDLPPIRLSYHQGNHYNSLVDPCKPTVGAGLGFGSLNRANVSRDQVKAAIKAQQDHLIEKALLAEGRYYSDLELTEQEMEHMAIEASRAEFLANERRQHFGCMESFDSAGAEPSSSGAIGSSRGQNNRLNSAKAVQRVPSSVNQSHFADAGSDLVASSNMRLLLSMGFSYIRVLEAISIFGDDVNDMLCYLLEVDLDSSQDVYRMKGKAAES